MAYKDKAKERACKREWARNRIASRKIEAMILLGGVCAVCGTSDDLEFHHIDPESKEIELRRLFVYSWERLLLELYKCQLLCEECHKSKHVRKSVCGTERAYHYGCRCVACKRAHTV